MTSSNASSFQAPFDLLRRLWSSLTRSRALACDSALSAQTAALADASSDPLLFLEPLAVVPSQLQQFRIVHANRRAHDLLAASSSALTGLSLEAALPFLAATVTVQQYRDVLQTGRPRTTTLAVEQSNIQARWLRISTTRFERGLLLTLHDLTDARERERELCHQVQHDALTGLPNRTLLDDRIQQALKRAHRNSQAAAVLLLDLDDFKSVNETFGRDAGDHVLQTVARRLSDAVRSTDSIIRLGGDEFVIVFGDVLTHTVTDFARKIVLSMFAPIAWQGRELTVTASIGVAMYPAAGTTPETLLVQADLEMNRMKRAHCPPTLGSAAPLPTETGTFSLTL